MSKQPSSSSAAHAASAGRDDLRHILGDIEDAKILEILALRPTLADLEEAAAWAAGDGDVLARSGHSLTATAAEIVDILTADDEESPPVR